MSPRRGAGPGETCPCPFGPRRRSAFGNGSPRAARLVRFERRVVISRRIDAKNGSIGKAEVQIFQTYAKRATGQLRVAARSATRRDGSRPYRRRRAGPRAGAPRRAGLSRAGVCPRTRLCADAAVTPGCSRQAPAPVGPVPRHVDTRCTPQTPHVASSISEIRLTCTLYPARHDDYVAQHCGRETRKRIWSHGRQHIVDALLHHIWPSGTGGLLTPGAPHRVRCRNAAEDIGPCHHLFGHAVNKLRIADISIAVGIDGV